MNLLSASTTLIAQSLTWALIHSLWQGLLIWLSLVIILKSFPAISAKIKYRLSFGALTAMGLWFADTWLSHYRQLQDVTVTVSTSGTDAYTAGTTYTLHTAAHAGGSTWKSMLPGIEHSYALIIAIYTAGLLFMACRLALGILHVRGLRTKGLMPLAAQYHDLLEGCMSRLNISRSLGFYLSQAVSTPTIVGAIKPMILLPLATINHLTTDQVEAILLHELAHIKRNDYLLNMVQATMETLLFFNPFVWLVSATIRREREHCCDDMAVACTGNPLPYAKALAALEMSKSNNRLALGATGKKSHLLIRIKRIMEMKTKKNNTSSRVALIMAAAFTVAISTAIFVFTPSFAQKAKKQTAVKADTATKSVYTYKTIISDSNGKRTVIEETGGKPKKMSPLKTAGVKVSITDDSEADGTRVFTKIIVDKTGKQQIIRTRTTTNGHEETIENKTNEDMFVDIQKMSDDLEHFAKNLTEAGVDINAIDWSELKENLNEKLADLNKAANIKVDIDISKELDASREAIKAAEVEIEKARKQHVLVEKRMQTDRIQAQKNAELTRKNIALGKKNEELGREQMKQAKKITEAYEPMLQQMQEEGLIDRAGNYKIVKDDGILYINEQKQPASVYDKYKKYMAGKVIVMKESNIDKIININ